MTRGNPPAGKRHGLARVISKSGLCSRSEAERRVRAGQVTVLGKVILDPEYPIAESRRSQVLVNGHELNTGRRIVIALNKPRGVITSASDEKGRDTVYRCLEGAVLPWLAPVGRLDKASEGLLLMTNDPEWAALLTDPRSHVDKTYHVQVRGSVTEDRLASMRSGVSIDGELWRVKTVSLLREGERTAWLEVTLDEGRNRQIRRICEALDLHVERLVRVALGALQLGTLSKGQWRELDPAEIDTLAAHTQ